ncbi:MAG TPA: excinuclease ABC subunit UvrC, partial [Armatimonadota bacterium]|nr:excinuclease ABC subunit UvrC [Armatimonadota bacterium]
MIDEALKEKLKHLPTDPGAYLMKDAHGEVIYVGKAASLRSRVRSYFQKGQAHETKVLMMLSKVQDVDWIVTGSEVEALMLECNLIKKHHPWYNVRLRDDKHYPYLCVTTSEPFPRVLVTRRVKADGNRYFGPFADSQAMRESLRMIRRIFKIRSCNKKLTGEEQDRPCLNFHMGQCDTPCSGRIGREEYAQLVHDTCLFLEGRRDSLVDRLRGEMIQASDELEFERAARLRDQIEAMTKVIERQKAISVELVDQDVIAISVNGNSAVVQLLFVRSGKLVGEEHFFLDGVTDETAETALGEFIKQYYRDATYIPREILVSHIPADYEVLRE